MTWGTSAWGVGSWGGAAASMSISYAYAISTSEVLVALTGVPASRSGLLTGDVLNVNSWAVELEDGSASFTVAGIYEYDGPLLWVVRILEVFPDNNVLLTVRATGLLDANGGLIDLPNDADFYGVVDVAVATPTAVAATRNYGLRDLANPMVPTSGTGADTNISGTMIIRGGDYALVDGPELLRKLIIRRLLTVPGDFFHLPKYGVGLRVKHPLPVSDLIKLQTEIRRQVLLEREVDECVVRLSQGDSSLTIVVRARLRATGQQVDATIDTPFAMAA